jgi:hypothetical protein
MQRPASWQDSFRTYIRVLSWITQTDIQVRSDTLVQQIQAPGVVVVAGPDVVAVDLDSKAVAVMVAVVEMAAEDKAAAIKKYV